MITFPRKTEHAVTRVGVKHADRVHFCDDLTIDHMTLTWVKGEGSVVRDPVLSSGQFIRGQSTRGLSKDVGKAGASGC